MKLNIFDSWKATLHLHQVRCATEKQKELRPGQSLGKHSAASTSTTVLPASYFHLLFL